MSAVNIIIQSDAVHVLTDGSVADANTAAAVGSTFAKAYIMPHIPAVMAVRGTVLFAGLLAATSGFLASDFDDFGEQLPEVARGILDHHANALRAAPQGFEVFVAGFSAHNGPEAWMFTNHTDHDGIPPWTRVSAQGVLMAPTTPDLQWWFSATYKDRKSGDEFDPVEDGIAIMRRQKQEPETRHLVGGFVQLTSVTREAITSRIIHRWPATSVAAAVEPLVGRGPRNLSDFLSDLQALGRAGAAT